MLKRKENMNSRAFLLIILSTCLYSEDAFYPSDTLNVKSKQIIVGLSYSSLDNLSPFNLAVQVVEDSTTSLTISYSRLL